MNSKAILFNILVLVLSEVILMTGSNLIDRPNVPGHNNVKNQVERAWIAKDKGVLLDALKVVSKANIEETANGGTELQNRDNNPGAEPKDEEESEGAFQADMMLTNKQKKDLENALNLHVLEKNNSDDHDNDNKDDDESGEVNDASDLVDEDKIARRKKRKATIFTEDYWPHGIIPVEFNLDNAADEATAIDAMLHWMEQTCLRFVYYTPEVADILGHNNRINLVSDQSGCWSYVGMVITGRQTVSIGNGCGHLGIIVHELGHAIGFHHEQSRPDRDNYITVQYENIEDGKENNFQKYPSNFVSTYGVPYDLQSIMHYGSFGFSKNGQKTIRTNNPDDQSVIGQRDGLSNADIAMANKMYNCP